MAIETIFLILAAILFIGFFGERIFERTKIPDVIWLILMGIILGSVFKLVSAKDFESFAPVFTTFALIFLLFESGINIELKKFLKSAPQGMKLSIISFIICFIAVFLISLLLGLGLYPSLILAAIMGNVESAVTIPIVKKLNISNGTKLSLFFDSAFSDILCIVATVTIIQIYALKSFNFLGTIEGLLTTFLVAIFIGLLFGLIWVTLGSRFFKSKGNFYIMTLAFMLVIYSVTQLLNANGAIACMVFGLLLGNSKGMRGFIELESEVIAKKGKDFYAELAFFIKTFVFVYLGILITFSQPLGFLWAVIITAALFLARPLAVKLTFNRNTSKNDLLVAQSLFPKGFSVAVLIQMAIQAGIGNSAMLINIGLGVVLLSIIISTIFVYLIEHNRYKGIKIFQKKPSEE